MSGFVLDCVDRRRNFIRDSERLKLQLRYRLESVTDCPSERVGVVLEPEQPGHCLRRFSSPENVVECQEALVGMAKVLEPRGQPLASTLLLTVALDVSSLLDPVRSDQGRDEHPKHSGAGGDDFSDVCPGGPVIHDDLDLRGGSRH